MTFGKFFFVEIMRKLPVYKKAVCGHLLSLDEERGKIFPILYPRSVCKEILFFGFLHKKCILQEETRFRALCIRDSRAFLDLEVSVRQQVRDGDHLVVVEEGDEGNAEMILETANSTGWWPEKSPPLP